MSTFAAALLIAANTAFPDDVVILSIDQEKVALYVGRPGNVAFHPTQRSEIDAADGHYADLGAMAIDAVRRQLGGVQCHQ